MTLSDYPASIKPLTAEVQRLRGWVATDPTRAAELATALVRLTSARLRVAAWAEALSDAQDAVAQTGRQLAAHGPLGPYTPMPAATEFATAALHLATIQLRLGAPAVANGSLTVALATMKEVPQVVAALDTDSWVHAGLAAADLAETEADPTTAAGLIETCLAADLPKDTEVLPLLVEIAAARNAATAGDRDGATGFAWAAHDRLHQLLPADPVRNPPVRRERYAELALATERTLATMLRATGDPQWGTVIGTELCRILTALAPADSRLLDSATAALAADLTDEPGQDDLGSTVPRTGSTQTQPQAAELLRLLPADTTGRAARRRAEVIAQFNTAAGRERAAAAQAAASRQADQRSAEDAQRSAAEAAAEAAAAQHALAEASRDREAANRAARQAAALQAEQDRAKARKAELAAEHQSPPEPVSPTEIDPFETAVIAARAARSTAHAEGRAAFRDATARLADALRPAAEADPERYGAELIDTLHDLSGLRLRSGDWWGSRGPAREAKELARRWGID